MRGQRCRDCKRARLDQHFYSFSQIAQFSPERGICHHQLEPSDSSSLGRGGHSPLPSSPANRDRCSSGARFVPPSWRPLAPRLGWRSLLSALTFKRHVVCVCAQILDQANDSNVTAKEAMTECEVMRLISSSRLFSALKTDN